MTRLVLTLGAVILLNIGITVIGKAVLKKVDN